MRLKDQTEAYRVFSLPGFTQSSGARKTHSLTSASKRARSCSSALEQKDEQREQTFTTGMSDHSEDMFKDNESDFVEMDEELELRGVLDQTRFIDAIARCLKIWSEGFSRQRPGVPELYSGWAIYQSLPSSYI